MSPSEQSYLQVLNLIMRRIMAGLELDLIRRDYYDSKVRKEIEEWLWG